MMLRRILHEESGVAMGLAVLVMVLVGVMGAGLLVFVNTDLKAVVQSNQGQKAFNLADAGVQAGRRYLLADAAPAHYDGTGADDIPWSCGAWNTTNQTCIASGHTLTLDGGASGDTMTVWIQYLLPTPANNPALLSDPRYAPELAPLDPATGQYNYELGKDYFKIIAEGRAGSAKRRVEAIYHTYSLDVPRAYYTPGTIDLNGDPTITNISLFAKENVTGKGGKAMAGTDLAYGDWNRLPNTTPRTGDPTANPPVPPDAAGIGALGTVASKTPGRDYDSTPTSTLKFGLAGDAGTGITFPFNPDVQPNLEELRYAALTQQETGRAQGNYYEITGPNTTVQLEEAGVTGLGPNDPRWPAGSTTSTVVYIKFSGTGNTVNWNVDDNAAPDECAAPVKGTLVVENALFKTQPNKAPLRGVVIVRGIPPGSWAYDDAGKSCMQSFANVSGDMRISGTVGAFTEERGNRPGFYNLRLWSWRECYNTACN